ncbi:ribosome silencing factor [Asticcacaulis biprosthecium]|uniref:ribosome silencing factor n=1 Tax=Asticcacaulis biprosthecium TaxID=76891 RepID=UPI0028690A25|nr:ribosome silencing factor [Asticcacaulis biprosthecium]
MIRSPLIVDHKGTQTLSLQPAQGAQPKASAASPAVTPDTIQAAHDETLPPLETLIVERLDDDKAQDIVCIDLKGKSSVADTLIIASGRSHRHVGALADHVLRALKEAGHGKAKVEGLPACDWVLIDVGDVVVHIFRPEVRTFYNIEKIWSLSPADA